jgi:hypothetical protein
VDYHTVLYNTLSVVSVGPPLADPLRGTDWLSYLAWYVNGAAGPSKSSPRCAGYQLEPVTIPGRAANPPRAGPTGTWWRASARAGSSGFLDDYERVGLGRVASHLRRVDEIGPALDAADLDDLARVLGPRPDAAEADAELVDFVERAGPEDEEALVRLLDARAQRTHLSMASPESLMLRHPPLRSLRPDRATARVAEESWPAGAIPGTR